MSKDLFKEVPWIFAAPFITLRTFPLCSNWLRDDMVGTTLYPTAVPTCGHRGLELRNFFPGLH